MLTIPALLLTSIFNYGFHSFGAAIFDGPGGVHAYGAYEFELRCLVARPGLKTCYSFKFIPFEAINSLPPDVIVDLPVAVWGTQTGHYCWQMGEWKLEMLSSDEAVRRQLVWESAGRGVAKSDIPQHANITIGSDIIEIDVADFS